MKNETWNVLALILGVLFLAAIGPWLWREVRELPGRRALAARAGEHVVTLEVGGMTCSGCAAKVQGELATVKGVSATQVRLHEGKAYVVCARDVADSTLLAAVSRAGPGFRAFVPLP